MKLDKNTYFIVEFIIIFFVSASASVIFDRLFNIEYIYGLFICSSLALILFLFYVKRSKK